MSEVIIFEDHAWRNFLPLTYWRPVFRLRCGRYPLMERLSAELPAWLTGLWVRDAIAAVTASRHGLPVNQRAEPGAVLLNARWLPMSGHVAQQIEAAPGPGTRAQAKVHSHRSPMQGRVDNAPLNHEDAPAYPGYRINTEDA